MKKKLCKTVITVSAVLLMVGAVSAQTTIIDDFEDNDISEYSGDTGQYQTQSSTVDHDTYALQGDADSGNFYELADTDSLTNVSAGNTYNVSIRFDSTGGVYDIGYGMQQEDRDEGYEMKVDAENSNLYILKRDIPDSDTVHIASDTSVSYSTGTWYTLQLDWRTNGSQWLSLYDQGNGEVTTIHGSDDDFQDGGIVFFTNSKGGAVTAFYDWYRCTDCNSAPSIDSNRTIPEDPILNDVVSGQVNASDPEGDSMNAWMTVQENSTTINQSLSMNEPATGDFELTDVFKTSTLNTFYNVTFIVGDGTGNTTTVNSNFIPSNQPPQIDNFEVKPNDPDLNDVLDYHANVTEPDGDDTDAWLTIEKDGTTINNSIGMNEPTADNFELNNVFKADQTEIWYNATVKVSDGKQNSTDTLNFYIQDDPPNLKINKPSNTTFFDYDNTWKISNNDDNDEVNGEVSKCNTWVDGQHLTTINLSEGSDSGDNSFRNNKGFHTFNASCTELNGSQLTTDKQRFFRVKRFELQSNSSNSQTWETVNESFSSSYQVGDMVNELKAYLWYDSSREDQKVNNPSGITSFSLTNYHEIPLVQNNQTSKTWFIQYRGNYTDFNGNSFTEEYRNSTDNSQEIWHNYYRKDNFTEPRNGEYLENQQYTHVTHVAKAQTSKGSLSGENTYLRNSNTTSLTQRNSNISTTVFEASQKVGKADNFNSSTFQTRSNVTVTFNGDKRYVTALDPVTVFKFQLFKNNPSTLTTAKTLVFDTDQENSDRDVNTSLDMDISAWVDRNQNIKRFSFQSFGKEEHDFYIYPDNADIQVRTFPYPNEAKFDEIKYTQEHSDSTTRSYYFPKPQTLDSSTSTVELLTVNDSDTQEVQFEVSRSDGTAAERVFCRVDRKFAGQGLHKTSLIFLTGSEGKDRGDAELGSVNYRFICIEDEQTIDTFGDQKMENPQRLRLGEGDALTFLDFTSDYDTSCQEDNTTHFTCDYQSNSAKHKFSNLQIFKLKPLTNKQVCSKTNPSTTGSITCPGLNTSANEYSFQITGVFPNQVNVTNTGKIGTPQPSYGQIGIIVTVIMFLFVFAATAFNPVAGIGLGTLTILISNVLQFIVLTSSQTAALVAITIAAAMVITR